MLLSAQTSGLTITLADALARAEKYGTQIQAANIAAQIAHEDKVQARAATLPSLNALNQFIYTEGNGTPSGVFVANDGVHVYNEQAVVHEELLSFVRRGEIRVAAAAEAVARAKSDVASRGLRATVVQNYYAIAAAERKLNNATRSLAEAREFLDITQKQEQGGEAAHSDVIKAQLQVQQRQRDLQDGELAIQKAKIGLAVLIFPSLQLDYSVVDDLAQIGALPEQPGFVAQATASNPDLRATRETLRQARLGVSVARYAYLPSLGLDFYYGIDANQFAARTGHPTQESGRSTLPNYLVPYRQNLGYSAAATLDDPHLDLGFDPQQGETGGFARKPGRARSHGHAEAGAGRYCQCFPGSRDRAGAGRLTALLIRSIGRKLAAYRVALQSWGGDYARSSRCPNHSQPGARGVRRRAGERIAWRSKISKR